ncbi:probable phospholipid hydroperoxide glutathione peroxidase [Tetranychus urticae]|uniref:Glutathione peroxidase n=1 Tax=Tetranychus urticae TaxID=32264 RepID=T1KB45_TETUR|nr:probable phospholipid hydroperoxide glutathione peroxidase [Tetranychus urticae]
MNDENINIDWKSATSIFDFTVKDLDGEDVPLEKYRGMVCLVVNVASNCGLTKSNYRQLNELYDKFKDTGKFAILAFPCNQFLGQEPACETDLKEFKLKQRIEFDFFAKVNVNGKLACPLYNFLKSKQGGILGDFIKWNFTKFLCNKEGIPVSRYGPRTEPLEIGKDIMAILDD